MTPDEEEANRLSDTIEARYRLTLFLFLGFVPAVVAFVALGAALAKVGVWIGNEDVVGRVLLVLTAVVAVAGRFWRKARTALTFLIVGAFGGRAAGFLFVAPEGYTWANRLGAGMVWAGVTLSFLMLVLQLDTLIAFREERREAGIE